MQDDNKVFGLMVQAEDIQKHAISLQSSAESVVKNVRATAEDAFGRFPEAIRSAVRETAREILVEGTEKASKGLLEASRGATAAAAELRSVQTGALVTHCVCLFLVAIGISAAVYVGFDFLAKRRAAELDALNSQVNAHRATLAELQSKTWGLELGADGKNRWIVLPKGSSFGKIGDMEDGRKAIFIQ